MLFFCIQSQTTAFHCQNLVLPYDHVGNVLRRACASLSGVDSEMRSGLCSPAWHSLGRAGPVWPGQGTPAVCAAELIGFAGEKAKLFRLNFA